MLKMPVRVYFAFLGRCELTGREYAVLKTSIVESAPSGDNVEVLCDASDAELLLQHAKNFYPDAVPYIQRALDSLHHLRS
jgi:hypothetical protein